MKGYTTVAGLLICLLVLAGCSTTGGNTPEGDAITQQVPVTPIPSIQEVLPSSTSPSGTEAAPATQPAPTATLTVQPTLTSGPTRIRPTPTPFPTFDVAYSTVSEEAATQNLIELLATNRGCKLPCWWGIVPGETNVNTIEPIFVHLGFDWNRDFETLNGNTPYRAYIDFTSEDGTVQTIEVRGGAGEETYDRNEAWQPYAIPRILESLGLPENVYVYYPFRFDPGGMQAYRLFLYYPDLGIEIDYLGKAGVVDERPQWARACPNILETDEINLFLFQPGSVPDYLERTMPESSLGFFPRGEEENPYDMLSWEQATETSLDEFYRLFTEAAEGSACFDFKTYWTGI